MEEELEMTVTEERAKIWELLEITLQEGLLEMKEGGMDAVKKLENEEKEWLKERIRTDEDQDNYKHKCKQITKLRNIDKKKTAAAERAEKKERLQSATRSKKTTKTPAKKKAAATSGSKRKWDDLEASADCDECVPYIVRSGLCCITY